MALLDNFTSRSAVAGTRASGVNGKKQLELGLRSQAGHTARTTCASVPPGRTQQRLCQCGYQSTHSCIIHLRVKLLQLEKRIAVRQPHQAQRRQPRRCSQLVLSIQAEELSLSNYVARILYTAICDGRGICTGGNLGMRRVAPTLFANALH